MLKPAARLRLQLRFPQPQVAFASASAHTDAAAVPELAQLSVTRLGALRHQVRCQFQQAQGYEPRADAKCRIAAGEEGHSAPAPDQ